MRQLELYVTINRIDSVNKTVWTVLIHNDDQRFRLVNEQYWQLIKLQRFNVEIEFVFFKSEKDQRTLMEIDALVDRYKKSELIFVQNEHDLILFDSL